MQPAGRGARYSDRRAFLIDNNNNNNNNNNIITTKRNVPTAATAAEGEEGLEAAATAEVEVEHRCASASLPSRCAGKL